MKGDRRRQALAVALLGAIALTAVPASPSFAAPRLCRQLQAELDGAPRDSSSPAQLRKYDSAISRQGDEIAKARNQARTLGCGFSLFSSNVSQCATLNASLSRMNGNLDKLERKRTELAGGGKRRSRARVMALLDKNGCNGRPAEEKAVTIRSSDGSVRRLLGETIGRADEPNGIQGDRAMRDLLVAPDTLHPPGGEYRTMCVRTCDGYFFPMSNAASVGDFERDQKNCESSCPGTAMQVFYTQGLDDDSANMTSVATGRRYSELPSAYLYKKPNASVPQSCGCNAPKSFSVIGGERAEPFWNAVRGNLDRLSDAAQWWTIVNEGPQAPVELSDEDRDFVRAAFDELPDEPWDAGVWKTWTAKVKKATERKGKALFMPLRLALTGLSSGPELADLLPLMGREGTLARRP